jgi:hypothetical protein
MSFSEDGKMLVDKTKIFKGIAGINSYDLHPQSLLNAKRMMVEKIKTQKRQRATAIVDPIVQLIAPGKLSRWYIPMAH